MNREKSQNSMVLLKGSISKLKCFKRSHDFAITEHQHQYIGATTIAATAMGMGSTGMGLLNVAQNSEEEAYWLEFEVDGKQVEGWVWKMPLGTGDIVDVAARQSSNGRFTAYGIRRIRDNLVAVYPHTTAGRKSHYRKTIKAWIICSILGQLFFLITALFQDGWGVLFDSNFHTYFPIYFLIPAIVFGAIAYRASSKLMGFVRLAEEIYRTFGWHNVERIDLRRSSRENPGDYKIEGFGETYFRYREAK